MRLICKTVLNVEIDLSLFTETLKIDPIKSQVLHTVSRISDYKLKQKLVFDHDLKCLYMQSGEAMRLVCTVDNSILKT